MPYCSDCGVAAESKERFCANCGQALDSAPPPWVKPPRANGPKALDAIFAVLLLRGTFTVLYLSGLL